MLHSCGKEIRYMVVIQTVIDYLPFLPVGNKPGPP
jgi:hypothetical protein